MSEAYVTADHIASVVFAGSVSARWVVEHVPGYRVSPRKKLFLESEARAWFQKRREEAA